MIGMTSARRCSICNEQLRAVTIQVDARTPKFFAKPLPAYLCLSCDRPSTC